MIKKIYIFIFLCTISIQLCAQETFKPQFAIGGSFGTTFSSVTFIPKIKNSMLMGYTGGIMARFDSEKNVGLQAELNLTQQGWDETFEDPKYEYSRTLSYVELPFLTHIYVGSKRFKFFLNLGPKIGYLLKDDSKQKNIDDKTGTITEQHNKKVENKFDWGLCGGPGMELRTGIGYFLIEGRYYYALGDMFKSRREDFFGKSASQVISVKLSYLIPLGKK